MAEIRLRPFEPADSEALSAWYASDPQGLEDMMGTPLPDPLACTLAFNAILQRHAERRSIFLMAICDNRAIGCVIVTDLSPEGDKGRPHIYIVPDERRHSFSVARAGEQMAQQLGIQHFMISVDPNNRRSLLFVRRLGYTDIPHLIFRKELSPWPEQQKPRHTGFPSFSEDSVPLEAPSVAAQKAS